MFTPLEVAIAVARLEYGVPLTDFNRRVLEWAAVLLLQSEEAVIEDDEYTYVA